MEVVVPVEVVRRRSSAVEGDDRDLAVARRPAAEAVLDLPAERPQVRRGERRGIGTEVDREVRRGCPEALAEERPHPAELRAHGGLLFGWHIAEEYEDRSVAIVGQVRQRRRDTGAVRLELVVEGVGRDAESGLERFAPVGGRGQASVEVQYRRFRRAVDEPLSSEETQTVSGAAVLPECFPAFEALQRRDGDPAGQDRYAAIPLPIQSQIEVGDLGAIDQFRVLRRSLA